MVDNVRVPDMRVGIDWYANGWVGTVSNVSEWVLHPPGITVERGKEAARPRSRPMVPSASYSLLNLDKRFSADNAGSPIYQFILPDRPTFIESVIGTDIDYEDPDIDYEDPSVFYEGAPSVRLFTGVTDDPVEHPGRDDETVEITALGMTAALRGITISTLLYSGIRTDEAINHVLDAAAWPADDRVISVGDSTLTWWYADGQDAWDLLMELFETEGTGASMYEDGFGRFVFESRNYRNVTARSTTSQATFRGDGLPGSMIITAMDKVQNRREVYNDVRMTMKRRAAQASANVWEFGQALTLGANEVLAVFAHGSDPWQSVSDVTVATDYVVSAGSLVSVTTSQINATTAVITFTAGAGGATVLGPASATTGPQLRGVAVTVTSEETVTATTGIAEVTVQSVIPVWNVGVAVVLGPSELIEYIAEGAFTNVEPLTVGTDFVVESGSLVDYDAVQLSPTQWSVTFEAGVAGARVLGPGNALSGPQLRAEADIIVNRFRTRTLNLTQEGARPEVSRATAQALVNAAADYYQQSRQTLSIEMLNVSPEQLEQMMIREISDRVTIAESDQGFNDDIWIEQMTHVITDNGLWYRVGIVGSRAIDFVAPVGLWDQGLWDDANWAT